jgi:hypothetical protein
MMPTGLLGTWAPAFHVSLSSPDVTWTLPAAAASPLWLSPTTTSPTRALRLSPRPQ